MRTDKLLGKGGGETSKFQHRIQVATRFHQVVAYLGFPWRLGVFLPSKTICQSIASLPPHYFTGYAFLLSNGERNCKSKVQYSRTRHNKTGQAFSSDRSNSLLLWPSRQNMLQKLPIILPGLQRRPQSSPIFRVNMENMNLNSNILFCFVVCFLDLQCFGSRSSAWQCYRCGLLGKNIMSCPQFIPLFSTRLSLPLVHLPRQPGIRVCCQF